MEKHCAHVAIFLLYIIPGCIMSRLRYYSTVYRYNIYPDITYLEMPDSPPVRELLSRDLAFALAPCVRPLPARAFYLVILHAAHCKVRRQTSSQNQHVAEADEKDITLYFWALCLWKRNVESYQ